MRKLQTTSFNFGPKFYDWFAKYDCLDLMRTYAASRGRYHNLWLILDVYDATAQTHGYVNGVLGSIKATLGNGLQDRETVLAFIDKSIQNNVRGFTMTNYLDGLGPRTHVILEGSGSYKCLADDAVIDYRAGDVLLFEQSDFGRAYVHTSGTPIIKQLITCWGPRPVNGQRNWQAFAEFERQRGLKEARA